MQSIEIKTTQNVTIEYELASVSDRGMAYMLDTAVLMVGHTALSIFFIWVFDIQDEGIISFLFGYLPFFAMILYFFLMEALLNGQTLGKKAMNLQVMRLDGQQPTWGDYLLRSCFLIIDVVFTLGIIAILLISSSDAKQRLGDMSSNTTVVKIKKNIRFLLSDILQINTLEDYEPQYPEVKKLSEEDMIFIKKAITSYAQYKNDAHRSVINQLVKKVEDKLDIHEKPKNKIEFLKTLLRDYIVLTR